MADNKKHEKFIVASGGTGMRCLQAFINMCAIGVFGNEKFNILLIDTDEENKDKRNTEKLIDSYKFLKKRTGGEYFSADLDLYSFVPDYSTDSTRDFVRLSQIELDNSDLNMRLANIFFEEEVQEFDLSHGYRAQTHLGSYLMYHAIIDEVRSAQKDSAKIATSQLYQFIKKVVDSNSNGGRLFAFGSSFGGTGASSIPVIPRAVSDAGQIAIDGAIEINNIYFGGVVLSSYFNFNPPSADQLDRERVIANSQFFGHNSAAALSYYINDPTILKKYKHLYLLGWPSAKKMYVELYKEKYLGVKNDGRTKTGGKHQENPAHVIELMAVSAAYHFMNEKLTPESTLKNYDKTQFLYKSLEVVDSEYYEISEEDVIPNSSDASTTSNALTEDKRFLNNAISFFTLGSMLQGSFENNLRSMLENLTYYNNSYSLSEDEIEQLTFFLNYFNKMKYGDNQFKPGWLTQMFLTFEENLQEYAFFGMPSKLFDHTINKQEWALAYKELNSKKPENEFIRQFKKSNKDDGGGLTEFLNAMKRTFDSMELNQQSKIEE